MSADLVQATTEQTAGAISTIASRLRSAAAELDDRHAQAMGTLRPGYAGDTLVSIAAHVLFEVGNATAGSDLQRLVHNAQEAEAARRRPIDPVESVESESEPEPDGPGPCPAMPWGDAFHTVFMAEDSPADAPQRCVACGGVWHPVDGRWEPGTVRLLKARQPEAVQLAPDGSTP